MSMHIYKTPDEVSVAVVALGAENRFKAIATALDDGGFELVVPDELDGLLAGLDLVDAHLSNLKQQKIASLTAACAAKIIGGYTSNALGAVHTYPSKTEDQINMMGAAAASQRANTVDEWSRPFWCKDLDGQWAFRPHSAPQIQAVDAAREAHTVRCQSTLDELTSTVNVAQTPEAVEAVVWPSSLT